MKLYRIIGKAGRVTIPCTLRACVGFEPNDVVSFEQISPDTVLVRREKIREPGAGSEPPGDALHQGVAGKPDGEPAPGRSVLPVHLSVCGGR